VPVTLAGKRPAINDRNIIIVRLPVQISSGQRTSVPSWLISSRLIACDGRLSSTDPWDPSFALETGTAVFEFQIPLGDRGGRAEALALLAPLEYHPAQSGGTAPTASRRGRMRGGGGMRGGGMRSGGGMQGGAAPQPAPGAPTPQGPGLEISAHNFVREIWQPLPTAMQPMPFPDPTQSMSPDGRVLVKITVPSGDVRVEGMDLSAEVRAF
jgi:hypothetical protein